MKKIFYTILHGLAFAVLLGGCEKFNDQFEGLEDMTKPINVATVSYTLTAADYTTIKNAAYAAATTDAEKALANSIATKQALNSTFLASKYAPAILNKLYYAFDKNSNVLLTYNFDNGPITYLANYESASTYKLLDADYINFGGLVGAIKYFVPSFTPAQGIPTYLSSKVTAPVLNQLALVEYRYSDTEPANSGPKDKTHLSEDFNDYLDKTAIDKRGWKSIETTGVRTWQGRVFSGNGYAQFTSYNSGELNVSYLVSPTIDLAGSEQNTFTFDVNVGYWNANCLKVFISQNYDGVNFSAATWIDVSSNFNIPSEPVSGYGLFPNAGTMNLNAYQNKITIAFQYSGDGTNNSKTTTFQVDNVKVKGITYLNTKSTAADAFKVYNAFYQYNGSAWKPATGVYALGAYDYDSMGEGTNQPGQYNNFSSTVLPANYLPALLAKTYPYAQEGTKQIVVYRYYTGSATVWRADEYLFSAGKWTNPSTIVQKTEQFIFTGSVWVFDPTVMHTMITSDYQLMVDYVLATPSIAVFAHPFYKNEEYYWGFSSRYSNVNFRISYRTPYFTGSFIQPITIDPEFHSLATDAAKVALMYERLKGGLNKFLQLRYPNAVSNVSGIPVNYNVTTLIYYANGVSSGNETHKYVYKCTASGSTGTLPTFEFISSSKVN